MSYLCYHVRHLYFGLVYLFFVGVLYFVVVVELIGEDVVKDFIMNFSVLIVNSSIVPECVFLRSSLQRNQNVYRSPWGEISHSYR